MAGFSASESRPSSIQGNGLAEWFAVKAGCTARSLDAGCVGLDKLLRRLSRRCRITSVTVHKRQRDGALGQQPDLARPLARCRDIGFGQDF
jgi:hypothetical protein